MAVQLIIPIGSPTEGRYGGLAAKAACKEQTGSLRLEGNSP